MLSVVMWQHVVYFVSGCTVPEERPSVRVLAISDH